MDVLIKFLQISSILAIAIWYLLFAPQWVRKASENLLMWTQIIVFRSVDAAVNVVSLSVHSLHWLGRVFVIVIFIGAGLTLTNNIAIIFNLGFLEQGSLTFKLTRLFEDKITWVASTAIVATTVALGHFRTLDLSYEKHRQEILERIREKRVRSNEKTQQINKSSPDK